MKGQLADDFLRPTCCKLSTIVFIRNLEKKMVRNNLVENNFSQNFLLLVLLLILLKPH